MGSGSEAIVVMAKEPRAGRVKTRLCPPLSPAAAADLHEAFVRDTLARLAGLDRPLILEALGPPAQTPRLAALARSFGVVLRAQSGVDLGSRMAAALGRGLAEARTVVLLGSDSPDLPPARVVRAFELLRGADLCVGPAEDGGYYLIGCRTVVPAVFDAAIPWGTARVLEATLQRAAAAGLRCELLDPWYDVDDADDLERLRRSIAQDGGLPHTRAVLDALDVARSG
jgi:hypothetical protein